MNPGGIVNLNKSPPRNDTPTSFALKSNMDKIYEQAVQAKRR